MFTEGGGRVAGTGGSEVPAPPVTLQVQSEDSEGPMTMSPSPRNIDNAEKQDAEPGPEEAITIDKGDEENEGGTEGEGNLFLEPPWIFTIQRLKILLVLLTE